MKKYVTTKELNDKYGVSNVTVAKWLLQISKGDLPINFEKVGKRIRIIDSMENWVKLEEIGLKATEKRQKIFSSKAIVNPELYKYFNNNELTEIVRDLEFKKYINFKFTYKGEGADYWEQFYQENEENGTYKTPQRTREVLNYYVKLIIDKMKKYDEVNIVEIGPGNALPTIDFIKKIKPKINLKKYIGIDISEGLLDQSIENISKEIDGLEFHKLALDIERDRVDSAFAYSYGEQKSVANIVLIIGGTILNSYEEKFILQNIKRSLSPDDFVIFNCNISNTENNLDFAKSYSPEAQVQDTWIPRMLGIDVDNCEIVAEYDKNTHRKVEYLILDKDYTLEFQKENFNRTVELRKNDKLYLWTYSITNLEDSIALFESAGYELIDSITLPDNKHFMIAVQAN